MFHWQHLFGIFLFFLGSLGIFFYSYIADFRDSVWDQLQARSGDKGKTVSTFKKPQLFSSQSNRPLLFLESDVLSINHDEKDIFFQLPIGYVFDQQGEKIEYRAALGSFNFSRNILGLKSDVSLNSKASKVSSDQLNYHLDSHYLTGQGRVTGDYIVPSTQDNLVISGDKLESNTLKQTGFFQGNVKGRVTRKRRYEEGVDFASQRLEFNLIVGRTDLMGDVHLIKENMHATARQGQLLLENYNKKLKYFSLLSDVVVKEKVVDARGNVIYRRALAESLEWFVGDHLVVLSENPRVYQDSDTIRGNRIILRENNSVIEVDDANSNFKVKKIGQ